MSDAPSQSTTSALLSMLELRGRNWSYVELGPTSGFSAPPSDSVYVHVVLHGAVRLAGVSGGTLTLERGQGAIILSGEAHALRTRPDAPVAALDFLREDRVVDIPPTAIVGASGPVAARMLSARLGIHWPDGLHRAALPAFLAIDLNAEDGPAALLRPEAFNLAGFGAGASALLTRLASLMLVAALRGSGALHGPRTDPIDQALRLIAANPSAPWTVEGLARNVGMGRSNFAAHFTQRVGKAPMEVITDKRMEQALSLLRQSGFKIAEIAEITGYGSEAAFSRRFARHFGAPPSLMRGGPHMDSKQGLPPAWQQLLPRGRLGENPPRLPKAERDAHGDRHGKGHPFVMGRR